GCPRALPSFPTRRSSDLSQAGLEEQRAVVVTQRLVKTGVLKLQSKRPRTARLVARLTQLPIAPGAAGGDVNIVAAWERALERPRSEEHTSELQSRENLVC